MGVTRERKEQKNVPLTCACDMVSTQLLSDRQADGVDVYLRAMEKPKSLCVLCCFCGVAVMIVTDEGAEHVQAIPGWMILCKTQSRRVVVGHVWIVEAKMVVVAWFARVGARYAMREVAVGGGDGGVAVVVVVGDLKSHARWGVGVAAKRAAMEEKKKKQMS